MVVLHDKVDGAQVVTSIECRIRQSENHRLERLAAIHIGKLDTFEVLLVAESILCHCHRAVVIGLADVVVYPCVLHIVSHLADIHVIDIITHHQHQPLTAVKSP